MADELAQAQPPLHDVEEAPDAISALRVVLRRSAVVLLVILIAAGVALVVASRLGDASTDVLRFDPAMLATAAAVYAVLQIGLMEIWRRELRDMGGAFGATAERSAWAVSQLGKYVPTGAALFVVRVILAARAGASKRIVFSSSLYEFGCSFLAALIITAAAVGSLDDLSGSAFRWAVYAVPVPLLVALHPRVFLPVANVALRRLGREPMTTTLSVRAVLGYVVAYAVAFAFAGLGILALASSVADVPGDRVWVIIATFSVGYVASVLGFLVPAGIGVRESGMALALSTVMPTTAAVSVAVASRLVQVAVECLMAGAFALGARRREAAPLPDGDALQR